jgi:SAM-dependent methyltransferase
MQIRTPWPIARSRQRRREFAAVFAAVPPQSLGDMLEIGSGDGFMASLLAPYGRSLTTTEAARGAASHARELPRLRCSAAALPFSDASFDFIFSSSVLEHVREREQAMAQLARCLRPDGVMVHIMPSPTWKLLQLSLYYPHVLVSGLELIGPSRQLPAATADAATTTTEQWRDEGAQLSWWAEFKRGILPQVHGEYPGHFRELLGFRAKAWVRAFRAAGFDVRGQVRLPLYSGYGFGFERLRHAGERWGLSAHHAYIITHRDAPPRSWPWPCAQAGSSNGR